MDLIVSYPKGYSRLLWEKCQTGELNGSLFFNVLAKKEGVYPEPFKTGWYSGGIFKYQGEKEPPRVYHFEDFQVIGFSLPDSNGLAHHGRVRIDRKIESYVWIDPVPLPELVLAKFYGWTHADIHFKREDIKIIDHPLEDTHAGSTKRK